MALVPSLERSPMGILALVLNIIPGGVGSILAGAVAKDTKTLIIGIVQLLLVWTFVAWVWSVVWGVLIFRESS